MEVNDGLRDAEGLGDDSRCPKLSSCGPKRDDNGDLERRSRPLGLRLPRCLFLPLSCLGKRSRIKAVLSCCSCVTLHSSFSPGLLRDPAIDSSMSASGWGDYRKICGKSRIIQGLYLSEQAPVMRAGIVSYRRWGFYRASSSSPQTKVLSGPACLDLSLAFAGLFGD